MTLYQSLADGLLEAHPLDAARELESLPAEEALSVLANARPAVVAVAVHHTAPHRAAWILSRLEPALAGQVLGDLGLDLAANLMRRIEPERRKELMDAVGPGPARSLGMLLRFPEGTAGALMDPNVLGLPGDLTAQDAHDHIRESPENVRYNLYVVDREQVLVGVMNLRELLLAGRKETLRSIAQAEVLSIPSLAGTHAILTHPAWREARSIPVVDEERKFLGAVRYQTMRRLDEEARGGGVEERDDSTVEALGDLFSTGIVGLFGALVTSASRPFPGSEKRGS